MKVMGWTFMAVGAFAIMLAGMVRFSGSPSPEARFECVVVSYLGAIQLGVGMLMANRGKP